MSTHTVKAVRRLVVAIVVLAVLVIAALAIGLIAQTKAAHADKNEAHDAKQIAQLAENELARFKAFTGSVLCELVQPIGAAVPPTSISSFGLTILHGAQHASNTLACQPPKGH